MTRAEAWGSTYNELLWDMVVAADMTSKEDAGVRDATQADIRKLMCG